MNELETKQAIVASLKSFADKPLAAAATALFESLGYKSEKRIVLKPNTPETFVATFAKDKPLNPETSLLGDWQSVDFLFQLTDDEVRAAAQGNQQFLFDSKGKWNGAAIESYLFFAITLAKPHYTRTELSGITRAVNRLFPMPAMLLFRHGDTLTLAVINRRVHKRDEAKDVLEKVTLIKDIRFTNPHRAHVEILNDLSFDSLRERHDFVNFVALHRAWQETLDIQALNKRFFIEVRNWFYWARIYAHFPDGAKKDADKRDSEALIRLLTRMIFCWFLCEKRLIAGELFTERTLETFMRDWRAGDCEKDKLGRYYKAILQNLFFATLNTPVEERKFRSNRSYQGKNPHYGKQQYFRHVALFQEKAPVEELYKTIPFLNGGLFEMLDEIPGRGDDSITEEKRVDGFSDVADKQALVPDFLFFGDERPEPKLCALLGESAAPKARGLIKIFRDYKFTIEENTPLEQDIALDPELLGRAFENLLAAVNPETGTVARKSTGSFYTPREIVNYMVEEAVFRHLFTALDVSKLSPSPPTLRSGVAGEGRGDVGSSTSRSTYLEQRLRELIAADKETHRFNDAEADAIVAAIGKMRILDPACGSGAFPMGLLQRLVHVLHKLDHGNVRWKAAKLATLPQEMREKAETVFREESFDYTRKLELIKDCIHGVDIQPAAIQISKLRFFLSLVIEQNDPRRVRPLPNLETKFVCANSLLGPPRPEGWELFQHQIEPHERALLDVRARYFFAQNKGEKDACHAEDFKLRQKLGDFIKGIGGSAAHQLASAVAAWNPYKPDRVAGYFDPESMFGVRDGFDITIGNPPYVRADEQSEWNQRQRAQITASEQYETLWEKWDLFVPFIERAYKLLKPGGVTTLIVSDAFCHSKYAQKPQNWFLKNARILRLDFCSDLQIFEAAVHNLIYFFQRADGTRHTPDRRVHRVTFGNVVMLPSDDQAKLTYRTFFPDEAESTSFFAETIPLSRICYISYGLRPNSDENDAQGKFSTADLVSETRDSVHCKPFVDGEHLRKWLPSKHLWLEWGTGRAPKKFCRPTFPELHDANEKIIARKNCGATPFAAYDNCQLVYTSTGIGLVPWCYLNGVRNNSLKKSARYKGEKPPRPDLPQREELEATSRLFAIKYLLAVINSSVSSAWLRKNRRHNVSLYPDDWKQLPIPVATPAQQKPIVALVERILTAKRADADANISSLEVELDTQINALYGIASSASTTTAATATAATATAVTLTKPSVTMVGRGTLTVVPTVYAGMKEFLRDYIVPKLISQAPYFNIETVRAELVAANNPLEPATLNSYLHELTEAQFIYDAGRGWYSSLATPFTLNRKPVSGLVQQLNKTFPLLDFSVWSTEQIASYGHHLLAKFVSFVQTDRDSMESLAESLRTTGWTVYLHPTQQEAAKTFRPAEKTVVVRPPVSRSPVDDKYATIEKILVDLCAESTALRLLDAGEYQRLVTNLAGRERISVGTLAQYAERRNLKVSDVLAGVIN